MLALVGLLLGAVVPATTTAVTTPETLGGPGGTARAPVVAAVGEPAHYPFEHATARTPAASGEAGILPGAAAVPEYPEPSALPENPLVLGLPVTGAAVTSLFGYRVDPLGGHTPEFHAGVDYGSPCGTDVVAAGAGAVVEAGWHAYGGGQRVVVDHGGGLQTTYNHLSVLGAPVGAAVQRGSPVGAVGSTGNSTGCHLHFEVLVDAQKVDPLAWLQPPG